jgi:hypothetical protein
MRGGRAATRAYLPPFQSAEELRMNQPKVHTDADNPPSEGANPEADPQPGMPHGIPEGATDTEAKGTPTSDRQHTETHPAKPQPGE